MSKENKNEEITFEEITQKTEELKKGVEEEKERASLANFERTQKVIENANSVVGSSYMSKARWKMENRQPSTEKLKDKTTLVDMSNYVPPAVQYARMRLAGANQALDRNLTYNPELAYMLQNAIDNGIENFNLDQLSDFCLPYYKDPKDVALFCKEKLKTLTKKYKQYQDEVDRINKETENQKMKQQFLNDLTNEWRKNPDLFAEFSRVNNLDNIVNTKNKKE